jgi:hypothetical protein
MTIPQQLADQSRTLFSPIADAGRWADHPVAIETRDHAVIRSWAACHGLLPAAPLTGRTGEEPVGTNGVRLAAGDGRSESVSTWADWLTRFDAMGLSLVFEGTVSSRRLARLDRTHGMPGCAADAGSPPKPDVDAATTGRFRLKRARVGF